MAIGAAACPTFCEFALLREVDCALVLTFSSLICSVWNYEEKRARFVEVKGPGDRLSSTQQVRLQSSVPATPVRTDIPSAPSFRFGSTSSLARA